MTDCLSHPSLEEESGVFIDQKLFFWKNEVN